LLLVVLERDALEREAVALRVDRELPAEPPLRDEPDLLAEDPDLRVEPPPLERFAFSAMSIPPCALVVLCRDYFMPNVAVTHA
jgi:hypothetical protein